ncbi:hypothetical protein K438DRAFT_1999053 [Mycena galopus ATCC 62051]|nr:hypothetical protein K438DRAFT_1999053 [Mycena galopus ATCC 62051]
MVSHEGVNDTGGPGYRDPAWVAFGKHEIDIVEEWVDTPTSGSELDDPGVSLAGYVLEEDWRRTAVKLSERMLAVSEQLARGTEWYGPDSRTESLGHIPFGINKKAVEKVHESTLVAHSCSLVARAILRSQLGWLAWFIAVVFEWGRGLPVADEVFINSLRLHERDRRGFLYNLTQDYHETNFFFLMQNLVPFHYAWTAAEKGTARFLRCSPKFLQELQDLTARNETDMRSMPSYSIWQDDLDRYDVFFQDTRFGKVGEVLTNFQPDWSYNLVEGVHFGAQPMDTRHERRVCAERFKGLVRTTRMGNRTVTTVTFFRQNPIRINDPPNRRQQPNPHRFQLSDFGRVASPNEHEENEIFSRDSFLDRERARFQCAPRPDRTFNSYNGALTSKGTTVVHPAHSALPSMSPGSSSVLGERGRS